jgi:glutaminyl-peptide cyclotransferase
MSHYRLPRSSPRRLCVALFSAALFALLATCAGPRAERPAFDGTRAYEDVRQQLDFGARVPGSEAHRRCAEWILDRLRTTTEHVSRQKFHHVLPATDPRYAALPDTLELSNLIASFRPELTRRILICAHWDSRPWADEDPDSTRRELPVPGANDGASGVAVGLELARILGLAPPPFGVDLVFFDGEDLGTSDDLSEFLVGSKWFAAQARNYRPMAVILLDMIGDADLKIAREGFSDSLAFGLTQLVWDQAGRLGLAAFVDSVGTPVIDDHLPFLFNGIPALDLIDFDYPHWHTTADTADKVSAASLATIGRLLVALVYETPAESYEQLRTGVPRPR